MTDSRTEPAQRPGPRRAARRLLTWTWGDALFVVLDPFWYTVDKPRPGDPDCGWSWSLGRAQYDWLKSTLASSRAQYKFIFIHQLEGGADKDARGGVEAAPFFEWGGENADGSDGFSAHRPGWGLPIHRLLVTYHVSAVFHGHDHVFVHQVLDGIVYQETPQSSNPGLDQARLAADYGYRSGEVRPNSGYLRIAVSPSAASVDYLPIGGGVEFSYTIPPGD